VTDFTMTSGDLDPMADDDPAQAPQPAIRVSVAVVEAHAPTRERIMALLGDGITPFSSLEELAARLTGAVPVVAVLGPSCSGEESLALSERIMREYPLMASILIVDELTTQLLQQALRAGVRDVLALSGESGALAQAVQRVAVTLDQAPRSAAMPAPVAPIEDVGVTPTVNGQVITVFSTKGGAGKSMLATSLAVELARRSGEPVCLVDADLQFGDVAVMLKLTPHHTIVDAVSVLDRMDPPLLDSLLVTHEPSGLRVMPAPLEPAFADQVGATEMVAIVEMLRSFCSFVIVDTPAYFNDVVLGLVEVSDRVLLVAGMDIPNIKNVKIGLQTLRLLNTPMDKLLLVLNRANSKVKLDVGEVERTLQVKADVLIPSDICVPQAVNKGEPVVLHAPKSGVTKSIQQLADRFLPQDAGRKRK
jgi:pilus assembly protein CpaE